MITGETKDHLTPGAIFDIEVCLLTMISRMIYPAWSEQPFIKVHITKKDVCELPFALPLRHSKKGLLFMNEIFFAPCSMHYWNMLKAVEPLQVPC